MIGQIYSQATNSFKIHLKKIEFEFRSMARFDADRAKLEFLEDILKTFVH